MMPGIFNFISKQNFFIKVYFDGMREYNKRAHSIFRCFYCASINSGLVPMTRFAIPLNSRGYVVKDKKFRGDTNQTATIGYVCPRCLTVNKGGIYE